MRDTKSLMLLLVSLLLVVVSFVLIWTWGYNYYAKNDNVKPAPVTAAVIDPSIITNNIRDSLQKVYDATLLDLGFQLDSTLTHTDSLKTELDIKLAEFYRLRNEIAVLLKNRNTNNNFSAVKKKIGELQVKADDLKKQNEDVGNENKKLSEVLNQIKNPETIPEKNLKPVNTVVSNTVEKSNSVYQLFSASALRFAAIKIDGDAETETTEAAQAVKFKGSFSVVNYNSQLSNADMVIVILKPDGRVLKNSGWDSGTFNTPEEKKVYTYKINFSYAKGESKFLSFSVKSGNLTKGNYSMEVYYNGMLIGSTAKTLF